MSVKLSIMINVKIDLPKRFENQLNHLKETTKKPKSFHVKEALIRYLEDVEDIRDALESLEKKKEPIPLRN